jgi:small-conductance mechanosensitive channel
VQVTELGNFAVTYRVAGFLPEVKHLLTTRSQLRKAIMDTLHGEGIEIVSPTFMDQRALRHGTKVIPAVETTATAALARQSDPEAIIFDKAEEAERAERLRAERDRLLDEIKEIKGHLDDADEPLRQELEQEIETRRSRSDSITEELSVAKDADDE